MIAAVLALLLMTTAPEQAAKPAPVPAVKPLAERRVGDVEFRPGMTVATIEAVWGPGKLVDDEGPRLVFEMGDGAYITAIAEGLPASRTGRVTRIILTRPNGDIVPVPLD